VLLELFLPLFVDHVEASITAAALVVATREAKVDDELDPADFEKIFSVGLAVQHCRDHLIHVVFFAVVSVTAPFCVKTTTERLLKLECLVPSEEHSDDLPYHTCVTTNLSNKHVKCVDRPFLIIDFGVLDQLNAEQPYFESFSLIIEQGSSLLVDLIVGEWYSQVRERKCS